MDGGWGMDGARRKVGAKTHLIYSNGSISGLDLDGYWEIDPGIRSGHERRKHAMGERSPKDSGSCMIT